MEKIKKPKLSSVCYKDQLRAAMNYVLVTKDNVVATNGHILVCHKTNEVFDNDFIKEIPGRILIHRELWKILEKPHYYSVIKDSNISVGFDGYEMKIPLRIEDEIGAKFPKFEKLLKSENIQVNKIGVNPKLLNTIYMAMNVSPYCYGVKMSFSGENKGILITNDENSCISLIMPIHVS